MSMLERVGVSLDKELLAKFDALIEKQGYANRSEAIRDLIRAQLDRQQLEKGSTQAVAGIFLIYDHHAANLTDKLNRLQHNHLLHIIASTHIHLDHHNCLEIIILKGKVAEIQKLADSMICLKGIKLGRTNIMTTGRDLT